MSDGYGWAYDDDAMDRPKTLEHQPFDPHTDRRGQAVYDDDDWDDDDDEGYDTLADALDEIWEDDNDD